MNPTEEIDKYIVSLTDWRGELLGKLRRLIHEVDPQIKEEWKWSTPVFSHNGQVCALGAFADHIKINFFKGANLSDPKKLFNAGLESKKTRAIDLFENDKIDESALKVLLKTAVDANSK